MVKARGEVATRLRRGQRGKRQGGRCREVGKQGKGGEEEEVKDGSGCVGRTLRLSAL